MSSRVNLPEKNISSFEEKDTIASNRIKAIFDEFRLEKGFSKRFSSSPEVSPDSITILFFKEINPAIKIISENQNCVLSQHLFLIKSEKDFSIQCSENVELSVFSMVLEKEFLNNFLPKEQSDFYEKLIFSGSTEIRNIELNKLNVFSISESLSSQKPFSSFKLSHLSFQVISLIINDLQNNQKAYSSKINYTDVEHLYQIRQKLITTTTNPESIQKLAMEAGMSTTKFKNSFKNVFGKSPYSYFLTYRMNQAKELILNEKKTLTEVSTLFGYKNTSNFSKVFKKYMAYLPSKLTANNGTQMTQIPAETRIYTDNQ